MRVLVAAVGLEQERSIDLESMKLTCWSLGEFEWRNFQFDAQNCVHCETQYIKGRAHNIIGVMP